jgi:hypothetical protein
MVSRRAGDEGTRGILKSEQERKQKKKPGNCGLWKDGEFYRLIKFR